MAAILTVFRSRLRSDLDVDGDYTPLADEMEATARTMPGFVDVRHYAGTDGERVTLVVFESKETHDAWRDHPRHRRAQGVGRDRFYADYELQVCEVLYERRFMGA